MTFPCHYFFFYFFYCCCHPKQIHVSQFKRTARCTFSKDPVFLGQINLSINFCSHRFIYLLTHHVHPRKTQHYCNVISEREPVGVSLKRLLITSE